MNAASASRWILAVAPDAVHRYELLPASGLGPTRGFLRRGATPGDAIAPVLETLPRGAELWIWWLGGWCQALPVPSPGPDGTPPDPAYEAEPFSGIPAAESAAVASPAPGAPGLAVVFQAARRDIDSLAAACAAAHMRLLGIGHPRQLAAADSDPAAAPDAPFSADAAEPLALDWAARARESRLPPLLAVFAKGGRPALSRRALAVAGAVLLPLVFAAGLAADWHHTKLAARNDELETLARQAQATDAQAAAVLRQKEALLKEAADSLAPRLRLQALRAQVPALYRALSAVLSPSFALRTATSPEPFAHEFVCWADSPAAAENALSALARELAPAGLLVLPRETRALQLLDDGAPWRVAFWVQATLPADPGATPAEDAWQ